MDGKIHDYRPDLRRGRIVGEDKRPYEFADTDWHSPGQPEPGEGVRFAAAADRATQIYRLPPPHVPSLTAGRAIEAVYRIGFSRTGYDRDWFGAPVRWGSFIAPVLVLLAFGALELLLGRRLPPIWQLSLPNAMLVLVLVAAGALLSLAIATGIVALMARILALRERIAAGMLAYLWSQAVMVRPAADFAQISAGPGISIANVAPIVLLAVLLIVVVIAAGRVLNSAFRLGGVVSGSVIVVIGGGIAYVVDRLLDSLF